MPLARTPVISIMGWIATTYAKSINRITLANKLYFRLKYLKYVKLNNNIIKALKGVSARLLFLKHPEIKRYLWEGNLWNPSYFVATVSENTEEQIRNYIQNQQVKWGEISDEKESI